MQAAQVSARELLAGLSVEDLRRRIDELEAERKAVMTLLRAAMRADKRKRTKEAANA